MISTAFLVWALFFPRLTLLITYCFSNIPANTVPFAADVCGALFVPNFLIAYYVYGKEGASVWFFLHVLLGLMRLFGERVSYTRKSE